MKTTPASAGNAEGSKGRARSPSRGMSSDLLPWVEVDMAVAFPSE
jgi:hypothetical protein